MRFIAFILLAMACASPVMADWRVGLQIGYSPNYLVKLSGTGVSGGMPYSANYDLEYQSAVELGINLWDTSPHAWGVISGFHYGAERSVSKATINGTSVPVSSDASKYQTHFLYVGAHYRWESFYIPIAITYGITKFTTAMGAQSLEVKNGIGALLGLGWFFTDNFAIEYIGRSAGTELNVSTASSKETSKGMISSALLNLKLFF
ncbi:hypothetical protein [Bdellovibrio bacteriovorus]|uniref:hypothetical protein n=1 Tax=Bdellovibrio bacteriovorus TaxID=959 RepID=UPI00397726B3